MNPAIVLQVLEAGLGAPVSDAGGKLHVASDPEHLIEILTAAAPQVFRVVLGFQGLAAVDPEEAPGIQNALFQVVIQGAAGMPVKPGHRIYKTSADGRLSLLAFANQVDLWFQAFTGTVNGDVDCQGFKFISRDWLEIEGAQLKQLVTVYRLRIGADQAEPDDAIALNWPA